ncbi:Alpha/beta hydrolase family protein [compost metagenome]
MEPTLAQKIWFKSLKYSSLVVPKKAAAWAEDIFLTPSRVPRPVSEKEWYESARKRTMSGGIAAYEWGPEDGPLVALVHGWSGRGTQLGAFAQPLVDKGYHVIAFDGPAHGNSQGQMTNVGEFSLFLIRMQQELAQPFKAVIAHSFGSGCSVLARARGLQAEKLVLIAGPSRYEVVVGNYLNFVGLSSRSKEYFVESLATKVGVSEKNLNVGKIGHDFHIPTMVVHDRDDKEVRYKAAEEIKEAWPEVELVTTQGLGHRRILKDAGVVEKVTEFITRS